MILDAYGVPVPPQPDYLPRSLMSAAFGKLSLEKFSQNSAFSSFYSAIVDTSGRHYPGAGSRKNKGRTLKFRRYAKLPDSGEGEKS